jgi:hypothetical protein
VTLGPRQTALVGWSFVALVLVYELLAMTHGEHATISEWVWSMSTSPLFAFACGLLAGHFFWQRSHCINCGRSPIHWEDK